MIDRLHDALLETATLTFEEMAFIVLEPFDDGPEEINPLVASTSVSFRGPFTGRLEVWASRDMLQTLASNMLGSEEIPPLLEQYDALGEITNIICGNMLPKIAGSSAVFYLQGPKVGAEHQDDGAAARIKLGMEPEQVDLLFYLQDKNFTEGVANDSSTGSR
ncbi:MAG TPA: chemotaxis protein CheX [Blastocatellia bacterium]|nr:chemotaxis protein CheX [Blastocatellia bacterium]